MSTEWVGQDVHSSTCDLWYRVSIVGFGVLAVPQALKEMKSQETIQSLFSMYLPPSPCILEGCAHIQLTTCICRYRFAGFGVMILTVIVEMFRHPFEGEAHTSHAPYLSNLSAIDMGGFSLLFSTAGVCQVCS